MSHITFENDTIAEVLKNAARISPKEGSLAYSFTPGIFIQVLDSGEIIVRSTDQQIFYTQWSSGIGHSGGSWEWHVTERIAKWCAGLPAGSGKQVLFSDDNDGMLTIKHGRAIHKVSLIEDMQYPHWEPFAEDNAYVINGFYNKIEQVQWAAALGSDKVRAEFTGVCLDGESIIATNGYRCARTPCELPAAKGRPITFPHKIVTPMLSGIPDVPVVIDGNNIGIAPDEYSQIYIRSFAESPATAARNMNTQYDHYLEYNNEQLSTALKLMIDSVGLSERPIVSLMIFNECIFLNMRGPKDDVAQDVIDVPGFATHDYAVTITFDPNYLLRAITNTPRRTGRLHYNKESARINYISCDDYQAWIAQKANSSGQY